jgi:Dolichyl-phosphate-mannose-protein mannosyltransferase
MIRKSPTPYLGILLGILLIKAAFIITTILHSGIGLSPDEAQYWTWSQQLDWGYYSKPPGVAWQIFTGTFFFGNIPLGVRACSVLIGIITPLLIYILARKCQQPVRTAFWCAILLALSPLGIISSMLAITDVGMILFWTCALIVITSSLSENRRPNYILLGVFIGLGALFKWPVYLLWVITLVMMPLFPNLRSKRFISGIVISLFGLLPSFTWNIQNDWATFRHVTSSIQGSHQTTQLFAGNPLDFIGAQAALLSPILFVILILSMINILRNHKNVSKGLLFCCYTTVLLFGAIIILSLFKKVQGNWCDYAYPSAIILIGWYGCHTSDAAKKWLIGGVVLSVALCVVLFSIPAIQSNNLLNQVKIPYKANPFRHNVGWENLPKALEGAGYDPSEDFLFSSKYQMSSILSFYSPDQHRAYFFNLFGIRNNQFTYWPNMHDKQIGKNGYYVIVENQPHLDKHLAIINDYIDKLTPYFEKVEYLGVTPLFTSYGEDVKGALIFHTTKYNGKEPADTLLY